MNGLNKLIVFSIAMVVSSCGLLDADRSALGSLSDSNAQSLFIADTSSARGATGQQQTPVIVGANAATARIVGSGIGRIFQTNRCNDLSRGGFVWFTNMANLDDWLSPLGADLIGRIKSQVDFERQGVLLADFGIEASPGGGYEMISRELLIQDTKGIVKLKKIKLPNDKKRVQVVTHPCTLYAMPRVGYQVLSVQNEHGDVLTEFENR